jgi:hypothetical protein
MFASGVQPAGKGIMNTNTDTIKISECNHPYWDENRCIDCGKSRSILDTENIWASFDTDTDGKLGQ